MVALRWSTLRSVAAVVVAGLLVGVVAVPAARAAEFSRIAGDSRVATAVAVSRHGWGTSDAVVIARADDPADALSGAALAGRLSAPLLITPSTALAHDVAAEVARLGARTAYVLGGEVALSGAVADGLSEAGVDAVVRLAGKDRYETAAVVARHLDVAPGGTALVVGGWPDALGVSGLAARRAASGEPWPVLVVNTDVPKATWEALDLLRPARVLLIGGEAAVPAPVADALIRRGYAVDRVAGATRYETSLRVAALSVGSGPLVLATGADFPDGLAAGPLAAALDGTLLLVPPQSADPVQLAGIAEFDGPSGVLVVGGPAAVNDGVATEVAQALPTASEQTASPTPIPTPEPTPDPEPEPTGDGWVMADRIAPTGLPTYDADVVVEPGTDLQTVVDAHPAGTTYLLTAGIHRLATATPKSGDTFVGQPGTVLSGARDLSAGAITWRAASGAWYVEGQTQTSSSNGTIDSGGNPWHAYGNELFVDDARWQRVGSVAELAPGRWFLDDAADRIWVGTDPTTLGRIEASAVEYAFDGPNVDGVTIDNVTVEKYANRSSHGAINAINSANWTIRRVTARWNHGAGVSTGPGSVLEYSRLHHNGQLGVKGVGTFRWGPREGQSLPVTVRHNEIAHNAVLDFKWSWEGGATKFAEHAAGILFEQNWVHHNDGPGPWFDVYNHDAVIRSNLVEHNTEKGIFYEISHGAVIYDNVVRYNGVGKSPVINAAGIYVSSSPDVEVFHNLVYGNPSGIVARSAGNRSPVVSNLHVHHNDIQVTEGRTGLNIDQGETTAAYTDRGNRFEANTYRLDSLTQRRFFWGDDSAKTTAQWRSYGQDADGSFLTELGGGSLPAGAVPFVPTVYGAGADL